MDKTYWLIKFPWTTEYKEYLSCAAIASIYNTLEDDKASNDALINAINDAPCLRQRESFRFTDRHEAYHISEELNKSFKSLAHTAGDLNESLKMIRLQSKVVRVYPKLDLLEEIVAERTANNKNFPALMSKVTKNKKVKKTK